LRGSEQASDTDDQSADEYDDADDGGGAVGDTDREVASELDSVDGSDGVAYDDRDGSGPRVRVDSDVDLAANYVTVDEADTDPGTSMRGRLTRRSAPVTDGASGVRRQVGHDFSLDSARTRPRAV
jgi:hypothetical protein